MEKQKIIPSKETYLRMLGDAMMARSLSYRKQAEAVMYDPSRTDEQAYDANANFMALAADYAEIAKGFYSAGGSEKKIIVVPAMGGLKGE